MSLHDQQQLVLLQKALGEHQSELLWSDFEAMLPDLFVTEPTNCKAEVLDIIPPCNTDTSLSVEEELIGSVADKNIAEGVSDVEELDDVLSRSSPPKSSRMVCVDAF